MSTAYSSKVLKVPIQYLVKLCILLNEDDAAAELKHYGIACDDTVVHFQRSNFNPHAKLVSTAQFFLLFLALVEFTGNGRRWLGLPGPKYGCWIFQI